MKKNGFTLVEVLGVIVIMVVIFLLVFPSVNHIIEKSEETINDVQINKILNATYDYSLKNLNLLPDEEKKIYITLSELKNVGLISANLIDIQTQKEFPNNLVISIENVGNNYNKKNKDSFIKGYYLYKVENDFMNTAEFKLHRPNIQFIGYEGDIIIPLDINEEYIPLEYSATNKNNEDITQDVIVTIYNDSHIVDEIDTSKPGIYYLDYTVIDKFGYSASKIVSIIIGDNESPTLYIPENITINIDVTTYDLMEGVSCTDNSGKCTISVNDEELKYGEIGKYIVNYSAIDPSGNTKTLKRVITIK